MMKVYKYGGNILKDRETRFSIYKQLKKETDKIIMVVSAFKESPYSTDSLNDLLVNYDDPYLNQRMLTAGELISSLIICSELRSLYVNANVIYPEEIGIYVDKTDDRIDVLRLDETNILNKLEHCKILVCPGFVALDSNNKIVSLNRGGSDLSAILIAKMLNLNTVYYFKDVYGVSLCNPKYYDTKKILNRVSYDKMICFAKHGSNLIQLEALKKAKEYQIELHIKHYLMLNEGTLVNDKKGDSSLQINIKDNKVYIDGYENASYLKKILFDNELDYDILVTIQDSIEITTNSHNEKEILQVICKNLFRS